MIFLVIGVIQSGLVLLIPYFSKLQVDQLENKYSDFFGVFSSSPEFIFVLIVFLSVIVNLLEKIFASISSVYNKKIDYNCSVKLEKELYNCIEKFDAGFMKNPRNRRIVNSSIDVTYLVGRLLSFASSQINITVAVFGILPIVAYFSPSIFIVLLFSGVVQIIIINSRTKKDIMLNVVKERKLSRFWELQNLIFYELQNITNIDSDNFVMKKYWGLRETRYNLEKKEEEIYGKYSILESLAQNFAYIFTALFAGFQVTNGNITIGSFIMLILYISLLQGVFRDISSVIPDLNSILIKFHKLEFFMNLKPRLKLDKIKNINYPVYGDILFENIDFSYPNFYKEEREYIKSIVRKEENLQKKSSFVWEFGDLSEWKQILSKKGGKMPIVLKKIGIKFKKGEITAIVGRNGSGKTTLVNLITRNYDPKRGNILIGNNKLINIEPKYVKKYISIIPQEPFMLESFSIRENISFGEFEKDIDEKIWKIFEVLDLKNEIEKLPKKLDAIIGDDVQFSGGQLQLLSIARVLIQNRSIIIFDEGTNQLDAEHEAKIVDILKKLKKEKTIIIITHRMTTARKADQIYVIDGGEIIEEGNHQKLIKKKKGLYKKFWDLQVVE
ncbi:MAG: ABC transporter ATP-binding protein [Patescibacteria group bacterium]|nr:ABC transporter ATP-binding protein [Patescibacteria group bacterium]